MFKRILTFVVLLLSVSLVANVSWAAEVSLLNANFERLKGKSIPYEVQFSAEAGNGTLTLNNGTAEGSFRVSAATVYLNGDVIVEPEGMNQNVSEIEINVSLEIDNLLVVQLVSAPESFIDISITQKVLVEAISTVGTEGGVVVVSDAGSPLVGTTLQVPQEALTEPVKITISTVEVPPELSPGTAIAGQVIDLGPDGLSFETPVILTLPYTDSNNDGIVDGTVIDEEFVVAGYFNESTQRWEALEVVGRDFQKNTVSIKTDHFSIYSPFVRSGNEVPQLTQSLANSVNGIIEIDGNSGDWAGLNPTKIDYDPEGDSVCELGSDIKHVYTAMDNEFAYVMIEMHDGPIKDDMTIQLDVDIRPGKDLNYSVYGDFGMNFHGSDGGAQYMTAAWNDSETISFHHTPEYPVSGINVVRGNVLEAKIPLSLIKPSSEEIYFNVTKIVTHIENYVNVCDVDELYPKIDFFRFQKRLYADKPDHTRFIFSQITRLGIYLTDIDYIEQIVITRPDNTTISLGQSDIQALPEFAAFGNYNQYNDKFYYGGYGPEYYFLKKYFEGEDLIIGDYKLALTDTDGNIYEALYKITRTEDIPTVDSNTVECNIDIDKNLYCDWIYPVFEDGLEPQLNALPHLIASNSGENLRILYVGLPYLEFEKRLKSDLMVPASVLSQLVDGADKLIFSVRTRTRTDNVRSYSAEIDISDIVFSGL